MMVLKERRSIFGTIAHDDDEGSDLVSRLSRVDFANTEFSPFSTIFIPQDKKMAEERIINRNPYLFGPGPIRRTPTGFMSYYGKLTMKNPVQGFSICALHGVALALAGSFCFKWFFGDPQIRTIENYYRENPPR